MKKRFRNLAEGLARRTTRRGLFSRGADVVFGTLLGAAAGAATRTNPVLAAHASTHCSFPGPPCACQHCQSNGVCAKPCIIYTFWYASGCWVAGGDITCCDCDCGGPDTVSACGCGSDYHNNPEFCPDGTA